MRNPLAAGLVKQKARAFGNMKFATFALFEELTFIQHLAEEARTKINLDGTLETTIVHRIDRC